MPVSAKKRPKEALTMATLKDRTVCMSQGQGEQCS